MDVCCSWFHRPLSINARHSLRVSSQQPAVAHHPQRIVLYMHFAVRLRCVRSQAYRPSPSGTTTGKFLNFPIWQTLLRISSQRRVVSVNYFTLQQVSAACTFTRAFLS